MTKRDKRKKRNKGVGQEKEMNMKYRNMWPRSSKKGAGTHKWLKGEKKKLGMGRILSKN